jgi:hypothetical protein
VALIQRFVKLGIGREHGLHEGRNQGKCFEGISGKVAAGGQDLGKIILAYQDSPHQIV